MTTLFRAALALLLAFGGLPARAESDEVVAAPVDETLFARSEYDEDAFREKPATVYTIPTPRPGEPPRQTVIGRVQTYRVKKGDTFLDLARYHGLGWNEITDANPHTDQWLPPAGAIILLPTEWVLPCCTYEGIVVNIPEMRLFFYQRSTENPDVTVVRTHPVGLGREEWRTPRGKFKIRGKTENPTWVIPESIRKEHIEERGDHRRSIEGGSPENPLGLHRLELTLPSYAIHGTNIPWGVGMQVSHGCVRLYPEDIARIFPTVPVGVPGEFAYQPVKVGTRDGVVFIETHRDIYRHAPALFREASGMIEAAGLATGVDEALLLEALQDTSGMPVPVTPEIETEHFRPAAYEPLAEDGPDDERVSDPDARQARDD